MIVALRKGPLGVLPFRVAGSLRHYARPPRVNLSGRRNSETALCRTEMAAL